LLRDELEVLEVIDAPCPPTPGLTDDVPCDYRVLSARIRGAGLLKRRPWYYSMKIAVTVMAFALGWMGFFLIGNSWWTIGLAALLAVLSVQVVFLGHDAGHGQIASSSRINRIIGLVVGNALSGMSFGWWIPKHNAHHAYPNQIDRDPDLGNGLVGFDVAADGDAAANPRVLGRLRTHLQAGLVVVVLLLQGLGLHVSSVQSVLRRRNRTAVIEGLLLAAHAAAYASLVLWVLSPLKALAFVAVQQGLFGLYLGCSFAPNHKGMPIIDKDAHLPFVERQVSTARNVAGAWFTTTVLGGLNYQIEHHLFPAMPRPNLAKAQPFVRLFCAEYNLAYCEARPVDSYRQAFGRVRA
jgi:fatty acid desaturase